VAETQQEQGGVRRRADARRNRDKILAAAKEAFANPDADASMIEVARRAGIGSATLYRNFPDRLTLLEALYIDEITAISASAATVEGETALERLQAWLRQFYDYFTDKRALARELLQHVGPDSAVFSSGYEQISAAGTRLVDAAREAGELREGLTLEQIFALVGSIAGISGPAAYRAPILEAALDALQSKT
jgi:AcrR family transcriptional regulator